MPDLNRYDKDPEAIAWARGKIQAVIARYVAFADRAVAEGHQKQAGEWQRIAGAAERDLLGQGDRIGSFDERLPALESRAQPATVDDVAAFLADVRMQAEDHRLVPAHMTLPLLAALEAVLELADDARSVDEAYDVEIDTFRPATWNLDPAEVREAITAALPGKDAGDARAAE